MVFAFDWFAFQSRKGNRNYYLNKRFLFNIKPVKCFRIVLFLLFVSVEVLHAFSVLITSTGPFLLRHKSMGLKHVQSFSQNLHLCYF